MAQDPLKDASLIPERPRQLFEKLSKSADGFTANEVATAAINLLINSIRQSKATRDEAAKAFDELTGQAKHLLLEKHYHGNGQRRNVFPHNQIIQVGPPDWSKSTIHRN